MTKRYKVWAVGEDAARQRTTLLQRGCLEREDGYILLVRTGSGESGDFDAGDFEGSAAEVAMLACERTGYSGAVVVKDFGPEAWFHGRASADGATIARGRY